VRLTATGDLERLVVLVAANLANSHGGGLPGAAARLTPDVVFQDRQRVRGPRPQASTHEEKKMNVLAKAPSGIRSRLPGRQPSSIEKARSSVRRTAVEVAGATAGAAARTGRAISANRGKVMAGAGLGTAGAILARRKLSGPAEPPTPVPVPINDETLADRVKSRIFREDAAPKGSVNVNAEQGVVYLRGEVEDGEWIGKLVAEAERVDGVSRVESLLHTPGRGAPTKENGSGSRAKKAG